MDKIYPLRIDAELYKKLKLRCVKDDVSIRAALEAAIKSYLSLKK